MPYTRNMGNDPRFLLIIEILKQKQLLAVFIKKKKKHLYLIFYQKQQIHAL